MTTKTPLSPEEFRQIAEAQLKDPSLVTHGKDIKTVANIRAGY